MKAHFHWNRWDKDLMLSREKKNTHTHKIKQLSERRRKEVFLY